MLSNMTFQDFAVSGMVIISTYYIVHYVAMIVLTCCWYVIGQIAIADSELWSKSNILDVLL